jgi:hypothetical protein
MKHKLQIQRFSLHQFDSREDLGFSAEDYSKLKYGSGSIARKFGEELAQKFFEEHYDIIVSRQLVVMESAYASIKNAASLITDHFINKLNNLIAELNGNHVERMKINRLVPYITDYGKLSVKKRVNLLKKDTFTFDASFVKNKFMIFLDDILITGTHQMKIEEMLSQYGLDVADAMCVYYAELTDQSQDPAIESFLNSAHVKGLSQLSTLISTDSDYRVIVRTVKSILQGTDHDQVANFIAMLSHTLLTEIYYACLGEGYYKNPAFSENFSILRNRFISISK